MDNQIRNMRLILENTQARQQEIRIDLVFEGNAVRQGLDYYGLWQDKEAETRCPFVMDSNGAVDFGTGYDGQDRYYETNILEIELNIGQEVGWRTDQYETTFRVVGMTQLA